MTACHTSVNGMDICGTIKTVKIIAFWVDMRGKIGIAARLIGERSIGVGCWHG